MTSDVLFQLSSASLESADAKLFRDVDLTMRSGRVTALLGPSGTGKSALLRTLAGRAGKGLSRSGTWSFRGQPLDESVAGKIAWFEQRRARDADVERVSLEHALASPEDVVLLDEPERSFVENEEVIAELLAGRRAGQSVVIVSHDLDLVRRAADDVALLCAGGVVETGAKDEFFDHPRSELAARFVRQGNCWPAPTMPDLPGHFRWLWPGELAGMGRPGLLREIDDDLAAIAVAGISLLVSLTVDEPPIARLRSFGIASRHFPIRDMDVPSIARTASLCGALARAIEHGERIAVHCHAGLGRTGTILGAMAIWRGATAVDAIRAVRAVNSGFIQNRAQELFLERFGESMGTG